MIFLILLKMSLKFKKISIEICINEIMDDLKSLNISHDNWFSESSLIDTGYLDETIGYS